MLFLCMELLALPTAADGNETKFKEMGEDSFGIATYNNSKGIIMVVNAVLSQGCHSLIRRSILRRKG